VEALGYGPFFVLCAALGIPGMLLLFKVAPWSASPAVPPSIAPATLE
jgi:PAT family beta-lactamase induction signal transducer AmpG